MLTMKKSWDWEKLINHYPASFLLPWLYSLIMISPLLFLNFAFQSYCKYFWLFLEHASGNSNFHCECHGSRPRSRRERALLFSTTVQLLYHWQWPWHCVSYSSTELRSHAGLSAASECHSEYGSSFPFLCLLNNLRDCRWIHFIHTF